MPICARCGEIIGSGHICTKCQEEFSHELAAQGRKKAYIITATFVLAAIVILPRMQTGAVSKVFSDASSTRHEFIPTVASVLEKVKEPASILDIQARLLFAAVVFALVGSFALLTIARR
jgi:cytochrome bd-type quinol oxidase subunit 2